MRPISLTLDGFQGYRDSQLIDLSQVERASITGRVGAGKSSMLDGVNFALFGKVRVPTKDGIIHTSCDKAVVELEFTEADTRYKVTRSLTRSGNSKAYLWRWDDEAYDWTAEGDQDGRVGVTDKAISDLIGLSWDAFRASVIVEQGKSNGFAEASPSERHTLLSQIVGLDRYARLAEVASEQRKAVRVNISQVEGRLDEQNALLADAENTRTQHTAAVNAAEQCAAALAGLDQQQELADAQADAARARLDLANQQAHVATARASADTTVASAGRHLADARQAVAALQRTADNAERARAAHQEAVEVRARADAGVKDATKAGEEARAALDLASAERARAVEDVSAIDERLAGLRRHDSDGCFTCGQALSEQQRAKVVSDLTAQRTALVARQGELDQAIQNATTARSRAADAYRNASRAFKDAQARIDAAGGPMQEAERAARELPQAQERLASAQAAYDEAVAARAALDDVEAVDLSEAQQSWQQAQARVEQVRRQIADAKEALAQAQTVIAVLDDRIARHETAREAVVALRAKLDALKDDEAGWTQLIEAYSPAGVPRMILDTAIEDINVDLDAELTNLSGGALTASLDTFRTTKAGTQKNEITLTVVGQDGARVYESFSGGQRFLVDLALHLALTKTLARRNGASLDFLAIDEGWGAIEGEEREAVLRALHEIATEHNALLLAITHVQEVADSFPTRIETEMISGTSVTTIH